jgi:RimJ/RimL family protein N-acetyltransferase
MIDYRILTFEDRDKYRQIRLECLKNYPQNFGSLYENESLSDTLKFDTIISQGDSTDFLYGAFDNQKLVATCGNIQEKRIKTKHISEISHVYVSPEYGSKGIATELLSLTIEKVFSNTEVEQIMLGVVASNLHAISLYEKSGFIKYGVLENYYKFNDEYEALVHMVLTRQTFKKKHG